MKPPIAIIGMGEMGGVFARGFLKLGHPVYPINRGMDIADQLSRLPDLALVIVAVGERDLPAVLDQLPSKWISKTFLLQNELLPADWQAYGSPTVISVWFEKKPGRDYKVIIPSPVYGSQAGIVAEALAAIGIPSKQLNSRDDLLFELVLKNLYILTSNIAGLRVGGSVGELWKGHPELTQSLAEEVIQLQEALTGHTFDDDALFHAMLAAFAGDPDHLCMGRSAPARLQRALQQATEQGLTLPTLESIADEMITT